MRIKKAEIPSVGKTNRLTMNYSKASFNSGSNHFIVYSKKMKKSIAKGNCIWPSNACLNERFTENSSQNGQIVNKSHF
ncbi:MAG: hypothetical protein U0T11_01655 [Chitinophagaceae bacterium]